MSAILTAAVTEPLPPTWQGPYSPDRARDWIAERDSEGVTLLVTDRESQQSIGLMILFESSTGDDLEVRLGYLLAESAWGRGLASELVEGFVGWCRGQPRVGSIVGGVEQENAASARVLLKNGFSPVDPAVGDGDRIYELKLNP